MKNSISKFIRTVCVLSSLAGAALLLNACGASSQNSTLTSAVAGVCSTGYVYSSTYGCLAQSSCSSGYGLYNGSCVYVGTTTATSCSTGYVYSATYGCLVQSGCATGYGLYNGSCVYTGTTTTTATTYQGSCSVGYVQTIYGCLPPGTCPTGYGYAVGMCYKSVYL